MYSTQGVLLAANDWTQPSRGPNDLSYGPVLEMGAWHDASFRFDADAGRYAVSIDDQPITLSNGAFPPAGWNAHLGTLNFGGGYFGAHTFITDIRISQP